MVAMLMIHSDMVKPLIKMLLQEWSFNHNPPLSSPFNSHDIKGAVLLRLTITPNAVQLGTRLVSDV